MSSSTPPPGKKFKASLACDICRARKSRCDGRRPTCSHCEAAGKTCVYRPTLTLLENDGNILARLNRIETRLDNLDAHGIGDSHSSPVPLPSTLSTTSDISPPNPHFPELHTAATFRMPQCWPRIRLCLTLPNIEPLQYLQRTEQAHPFDVDTRNSLNGSPTIPLSSAIASVEALFEATDLGIDLLELLHHCSPISRNEILTLMRSRCPPQSIDGGEVQLQLTACSVQELLILTIALHQARFEESIIIANYQGFSLSASFDTCFRIALSHFWKVNFLPDETAIPILQVTVIIFSICFLRPHHALRMIEMVGDRLARRAKRGWKDLTIPAHWPACLNIHFLQESDFLTHVDGTPSPTSSEISERLSSGLLLPNSIPSPYLPSLDTNTMTAHIWLRIHLNRTLSELYTIDQAYCHPRDIMQMVTLQESRLDEWYHRQPPLFKFPKDVSSARESTSSQINSYNVLSLALRYYTCSFLLHRPMLYYLAHEDLELSASRLADTREDYPSTFWLFESCRRCLQSAALIVLTCKRIEEQQPNRQGTRLCFTSSCSWIELQTLMAAGMALILAQATPSLFWLLRDCGDPNAIEELIHVSEEILSKSAKDSPVSHDALMIFQNIRHNFLQV